MMDDLCTRLYKCPVCGKKFIPAAQHVYKVDNRFVCSWGCQRKAEKEKEEKKKKRKDGVKNERKSAPR